MPNLFDFLNRHQVYLEGVKNWQYTDFLRYLRALGADIRKALAAVGGKLDDLANGAFRRLLKRLTDLVGKHLGAHAEEMLLEIRRFTRIDIVLQRSASALITGKNVSAATIGGVWKEVSAQTVPAFGMTIKEAAGDFIDRTKALVRSTLSTGRADRLSTAEAADTIVGKGAEFTDGVFRQIASRAQSLLSTAYQAASAAVTDTIGKLVYGCYQWCSVIDGVTSAICRERNGQVYRYGEGPRPPAHPRCRSRTIPCPCDGDKPKVPTFFTWLKAQSSAFITDVYGRAVAEQFANDTAKASDFLAFRDAKPLTLDEFELKADVMVN